jgi:hypothetical protein
MKIKIDNIIKRTISCYPDISDIQYQIENITNGFFIIIPKHQNGWNIYSIIKEIFLNLNNELSLSFASIENDGIKLILINR